MPTTITTSAGTLYPLAVSEYSTRRNARSIVHDVLGRADPDVTIRPASLRSGMLRMSFNSAASSLAAENAHATGQSFTVVSPVAGVAMRYVVAGGQIERSYSDAGEWVLMVPFQEVLS